MDESCVHVFYFGTEQDDFSVVQQLLAEAESADFYIEFSRSLSDAEAAVRQPEYDVFIVDY